MIIASPALQMKMHEGLNVIEISARQDVSTVWTMETDACSGN